MSVQRIESYTTQSGDKVLKVILKPTKNFPEGKNFFYTDDNEITRELIENYTWCLVQQGNNIYVIAMLGSPNTGQKRLYFHQEYAKEVLGFYSDCIDHIDRLEINNRNYNLNIVTNQQNVRNQPTIGYRFDTRCKVFQPYFIINNKTYYRGSFKSEPEALIATFKLREEVYSDYNYNFLLDRREDIDIVNLELTGQISTEEATEMHIRRYVELNPWYVYRYNLFDYCQAHNIVIPDFTLDEQGFMISPVTKERLCPY